MHFRWVVTSIFVFLLALASWLPGFSQSNEPVYSLLQLDNRYGLSNSAVNCLLQDSDGMLWIGTWDGLNRYDGQEFHVSNVGGSDAKRGLISNTIRGLLEDCDRRIWISTVEGLSRDDKLTGTFRHYFYGANRKQGIGENGFGLIADTAGRLFARTPTVPLMRYDAARDTFVSCPLPGISGALSDFCIDAVNRLWVRTDEGAIAAYTPTANGFRLAHRLRPTEPALSELHLTNGSLFLSDPNGLLYLVHPNTFELEQIADLGSAIR